MKARHRLDACPKCGSYKGYYQKSTWYGETMFDWETGETVPQHLEPAWISTMVACIDCGARFKEATIKRMRDEGNRT